VTFDLDLQPRELFLYFSIIFGCDIRNGSVQVCVYGLIAIVNQFSISVWVLLSLLYFVKPLIGSV